MVTRCDILKHVDALAHSLQEPNSLYLLLFRLSVSGLSVGDSHSLMPNHSILLPPLPCGLLDLFLSSLTSALVPFPSQYHEACCNCCRMMGMSVEMWSSPFCCNSCRAAWESLPDKSPIQSGGGCCQVM